MAKTTAPGADTQADLSAAGAKADNRPDGRPLARVPRGMRDIGANEIRALETMLATIRGVYDSYGYEPLDTPAFEFTDALGKFLPDQDRPNAGVFSFKDEDDEWLSLRYDLTAPLARYVAENFEKLPKPFRRYHNGYVFRNEKPGPGRFRQFMQFDADTVGTDNVAADAEACMLMADTLEKLGIARGQYVIKLNNRKVLDGVLEQLGIRPNDPADLAKKMTVLRAIDKLDRLGFRGVEQLLGRGRKDESGDFTPGAGLETSGIELVMRFMSAGAKSRTATLAALEPLVAKSETGRTGVAELAGIEAILTGSGFGADQVAIDPAIVRGLDYYTGPVFEAQLALESTNEAGELQQYSTVGGGGRYDDLVARFTGQRVPATGFSIGVSRLLSALQRLGQSGSAQVQGPVVVLVLDKDQLAAYQKLTRTLRQAGVRAEMYLGTAGMKAQMKYADKRGSPAVVIQGGDERAKGEVTIKDLVEGAKAAEAIKDNKEWREGRPAQVAVPEAQMVETVRAILARHGAG
jgi:histidyl-tRNA synthetase